MNEHRHNLEPHKNRAIRICENILFGVCLSALALRTTVTEGLSAQTSTQPINFGSTVFSLLVSGLLIFAFVLWFVANVLSKKFHYRFTGIEIGIALLIIAVIISSFYASNKRAAITEAIIVIAPILMAVLLIQLLNSQYKIRLVLAVIAALGVVQSYQCSDQLFVANQMNIQQYEKNPEGFLEPLGIQPGSFQQWLFEHRLYTKAVSGFFTNKNSVGCFFVLAWFAAFILFAEKFKSYKIKQTSFLTLFCSAIALTFILWGLLITKSKGAILAATLSFIMFIAFLFFPHRLKKHRKSIFILILFLAVLGCIGIVSYGQSHGRLPGGNSMLVRWQYWSSTAKMIAKHPLTGVGAGNFAYHFTHYKFPGALESVADPHNFILSFLAQYGPLGLIALLLMLFIPLGKVISEPKNNPRTKAAQNEKSFSRLAWPFILIIALLLLCIRPFLIHVTGDIETGVLLYIFFVLYVAPVIVFLLGFWLLSRNIQTTEWFESGLTIAALFCAVVAVLLQNLIDFAIFEPGVSTSFWALIACLLALNAQKKKQRVHIMAAPLILKGCISVLAFVLLYAYLAYAFSPVACAAAKTKKAIAAPGFPHQLLNQAAETDKLDPIPLSLNGKLYLEHYRRAKTVQPDLLQSAVEAFLTAIERNPADFKNFERLAETYLILAESDVRKKQPYLQKAIQSSDLAIELYPGSAKLQLLKASIAEKLGKKDMALQHYKKTVEIEDAFRNQFAVMYPDRQMISRLGHEKYNLAKTKIAELRK
jgi:tetratricopeptide (TPR) repeat protein